MITIDPPSSSFELSALNKSALTRFLKRAAASVELEGEVQILLTSDAEIKRLNQAFRGKNKPTDILSFPASDEAENIAGDLAISLETAVRQAAEHSHPLQAELKILILHGLLHLAGEDHETDSGEMAARELTLRRQLGLREGLIERAR
jgi:probable rRNA maturation factor